MQRGYRKRVIEIRTEFAKFNTSQRIANQAKMILKKDWLFDLEVLEICWQLNREEQSQREFP